MCASKAGEFVRFEYHADSALRCVRNGECKHELMILVSAVGMPCRPFPMTL